jgi:chromosomal replication initiator protein
MEKMNNSTTIWDKIRKRFEQEFGSHIYKTWIKPLRLIDIEKNSISLQVPNIFFKDWIKEHYLEKIFQMLKEETNSDYNIKFSISPDISNSLSDKKVEILKRPEIKKLNPKYTFEKFVIGDCNKFAHAASFAVASAPAKAYNPLFIYGGVGLGKTHLLQAIGNKILETYSGLKVQYISSEEFTNQLIIAIQTRSTQQFREKYRNIDVLLIDDIHFLSGKESTQEEFFHTFNALYEAHRQIVISSDRSPKDIPDLEERLVSRFHWGLICDVIPPNYETRMAILRKKAEDVDVKIPNNILAYIAEKITSNIRELEGALIRVIAHATLFEEELTSELAQSILEDMVKEEKKKISLLLVVEKVAKFFNLAPSDLKAKSRKKNLILPRQISMYLARELTNLSLSEIGEAFGKKDHTTVIYACQKIKSLLSLDNKIKKTVETLKDLICKEK